MHAVPGVRHRDLKPQNVLSLTVVPVGYLSPTYAQEVHTAEGERLQSLLSWRDPRATTLFVIFCLVAAIVLYVTPFQGSVTNFVY